jgi:class 3 adenylate cyclase
MSTWESDTGIVQRIGAVLFADVSGWTDLCSRRGDEVALALRDELFDPLRKIVERHDGRVVKTNGDELMCLFESAEHTARAACAMQRFATRVNAETDEPLPLRIGFHVGRLLMINTDVEGDTVNIAAQVVQASQPERILTTQESAVHLSQDFSRLVRPWRIEAVKGREKPLELVEVVWRAIDSAAGRKAEADARQSRTIPGASKEASGPRFARFILRCQGKECELRPGGKPLTFGRSAHHDLVIDDRQSFVSGTHGKIEIRGGSIVLTDNSRNGIYVSFGTERFFLVDKQLVLHASGRMMLGRPPHDPEAITLEFELE